MINEFEVKMTPDSNWELKFINIFNGISISNNETDYRNKIRTKLDSDNHFDIEERKNKKGYKYFVLTITSKKYTVQIRAVSRISLEYFIYHATQTNPTDTGRPLTFYPHLSNFEAPLVEERIKENNFQGLFNLLLLILFLTHFRVIYSNFMKYGPILTPRYIISFCSNYKNFLFIFLSFALVIVITILTYLIEKLASHHVRFRWIYILHSVNLFFLASVPLLFHKLDIMTPIAGFIGLFIITCFTLKIISYAHFWYDVRRFIDTKKLPFESTMKTLCMEIKEVIEHYPNNVTFSNLISFLCMPCLCYQYKYPRTQRIKKRYVLIYSVQGIICIILFVVISVQYTIPTVERTFNYIDNKDYSNLFDKFLKLLIPSVYSWLILFYGFFHCWMTVLAELTRFADRSFYKDWWNSLYLDEYWRKWNIPTHYWLMRHVYNPLRRRKFSKLFCSGVAFFFSGIIHEYVISGGLGYFALYAFFAMFINFPASVIQIMIREDKRFACIKNSQIWNIFFWISFCFIGQPVAVILYFYEYSKLHPKEFSNIS